MTWDDLFGESETDVVEPYKASAGANPALPANPSAIPTIPKNLVKSYQNFLQQPQKDAGLVQQENLPEILLLLRKNLAKLLLVNELLLLFLNLKLKLAVLVKKAKFLSISKLPKLKHSQIG